LAHRLTSKLHKTRTRSWLALLSLGCVLFAACGKSPEDQDAGVAVPEVTVTTVKRAPLSQELLVSGNLATLPNRDAKLAALVPGRIKAVLVTEGDRVESGKALVELDSVSLTDQLHQAEAAVTQAKANVENARISAARNEGLLQRGIAARKEVEDTRTQLAVNEAALKQAEAAQSAARTQVARAIIRSPFAGTVVHRFLGVGEQVDGSGSQPVVEVANIDTLELLGTVPASRLSEIQNGGEFSFQTTQVPGATFKAKIVAILPAVDPATNNGTVRVRIDNRSHLLKLGMFISIDLPLKQQKQRLIVPRQAIYPDESGEPHIYKVSGDQVEAVPVQLGIQTPDQAEILSGVQEGDKVILTGGYGLSDKAKVHIKQ
jgi:membrane fusion protein, multidrug efflux system